jgi:hypothetical protein
MMKKLLFFFCILFVFSVFTVYSQTTESENIRVTTTTIEPNLKPKSEFPQWVLDLRRFDIILFGSFPFTYWFASTAMDTYRSSQHNWDSRYAPWPAKSAGAINMTNDEYALTLACAAAGSALVALADHIIVRIKRSRAAREAAKLSPGEVIVTRRPMPVEAGVDKENGAETDGGGSAGSDAVDGSDSAGAAGTGASETAPAREP